MRFGRLLFLFLFPALVVDAFNGLLIRLDVGLGLSQYYRALVVIFIIIWLGTHTRKGFAYALLVSGIVYLCSTYHALYFEALEWLRLDFHFQIRLILHFIIFIFFWYYTSLAIRLGRSGQVFSDFKKMLFFSYGFVLLNILLGFIGVGYSAHYSQFGGDDGGYGALGFFKAANDVSAVFIVLAGIAQYFVWNKGRGYFKYLLISSASLFGALGLQSKVSIIGICLVIAAVPFLSSGLLSNMRIKKRPLLLLLASLGVFTSVVYWLVSTDAGIVQRFIWFYEESGIVFAIMTGRNYFFAMAMEVLNTNFDLMDMLFGHGWSYYLAEMGSLYKTEKLVEIDYVDIFMINGIIGLTLVTSMWTIYLLLAWRLVGVSKIAKIVIFVDVILLGIAGTSGHVLYSTINGLFIASLQMLPMLEYASASRKSIVPSVTENGVGIK